MKLKKQFRAFRADELAIGEDDTVEFPFSSEEPVERWFGKEVLSHDQGAMDMSRVQTGAAPLLWNHDPDQPIGMIEAGDLRGKRLFAKAKFFTTPFAQEKKKQMQEGLKNVSFGYQIQEMKLMNPKSESEPEYLATKWQPFEVSIVSVPADYKNVGIGRTDSDDEQEVKIINPLKGEKRNMEKQHETAPAVEAAPKVDVAKLRTEAQAEERARAAAINTLGEKFKKQDLARQLIDGGKSVEEARTAFLEQLGVRQEPVSGNEGEIGLSNKEKRSYSFVKAMRAMMLPNDRQAQEDAKFERECAEAAIKATGKKNVRGYLVPADVLRQPLMEKRDMTVGTSTAGGNVVSTDLLASSFIDLLRNKSVLNQAGATVLNGLVGNIAIPKQTGAATAYWVAESGSPTEGAQTIGQVTMSPHTVGAFTDYSRRLLLQSSIDIEAFIRNDLSTIIALEIDRAGLYGSGSSNQPTGLQNIAGAVTKDFAADAPTYAEIVSLESTVATSNALEGALKYLLNPNGRGVLKGVFTNATYGEIPVFKDNQVNGYDALVSAQVSKVSSGKEHYWFGNWSDLMIGFWSGLDLLVDPYTGSTSGTVRIVALQDCDVAVRHAESFILGSNLS